MSDNTLCSYEKIIQLCQKIFEQKNQDYGTSWLVLRMPSFTDLIMIKTSLVKSLEKNTNITEFKNEFIGIINYSIMALIALGNYFPKGTLITEKKLRTSYQIVTEKNKKLLKKKNAKYKEIWREMRLISIIDIIHMKLHRIRSIEEKNIPLLASEGVDANYQDIINYAVFALIKLNKKKSIQDQSTTSSF